MLSFGGIYLYFNDKQTQISDIEIMAGAFVSYGYFGSRVRSKFIGHNKYTGKRRNLRSKPTPIHGPVHKSESDISYSRIHFSRLPQAGSKILINILSHKVSYASIMVYSVFYGFIPNRVSIHLHVCDQSIITFGKEASV